MLFYVALNERGHTMTPNKTPDQSPKPEWFELTENQTPSAGLRKVNKVLPITTLVVAGGLLLGGSLFANANNENAIPTQDSASTQSVAASAPATTVASVSNNSAAVTPAKPTTVKTVTGANGLPMPVVTNVPQRGDDDDDEHEGRKRGDRERDHDDDDDRDEDEDDD